MAEQEIYQALADPTRRRILEMLRQRSLMAGEIAQQFEMSWPSISRHLGVLRSAGLIESEKVGTSVVYSLAADELGAVANEIGRLAGRRPGERYQVFERFNDQARRVMAYAQEEARELGHAAVGTEHLMLGLLGVEEGVASRCLDSLGIRSDSFREQVRASLSAQERAEGPLAFTGGARKVLDEALAEGTKLGHTYVGSGPLLLALLSHVEQDQTDLTGRLLTAGFGAAIDRIRTDVMERMRGYEEAAREPETVRVIARGFADPQTVTQLTEALARPGRGGRGMFERFTDRARRVVVLAQEEARLLHHNYIGTEHLLLGLVHEGEGLAGKVLDSLGVTLARARASITEMIGVGSGVPQGHIPFTPRSKKCLEISLRESLKLGHNYIGTEHILLGILAEGEGVAAQILIKYGLTLKQVEAAVLEQIKNYAPEMAGSTLGVNDRIDSLERTLATGLDEMKKILEEILKHLRGDDQATGTG
jgi:ATP-dependent Clp protease ATP-binding subunit ClpA